MNDHDFTPEAIREVLRTSGFATYDPDDPNPEGFTVKEPAFGCAIVVSLRGFGLLPFNPGEGPRALLDGYAQALDDRGYSVMLTPTAVIVGGVRASVSAAPTQ